MSLNSWKEEFYKKDASDIDNRKDAIEHSLLKWSGLTNQNMTKHGVNLDRGEITDDFSSRPFIFGWMTCSLCRLYEGEDGCRECPLFQSLGHRCDDGEESPYSIFIKNDNPNPMIEALNRIGE